MNIKNISDLHKSRNEIPDQAEILKAEWKDIRSILSLDIERCNFGLKHWIMKRKYKTFMTTQSLPEMSF